MDQRLNDALEFSNYRLTLANHKKNLRLRAEALQVVSHAGGMFRADTALITWLDLVIRSGAEQYVLIDQNDQPVLITDLAVLKDRLFDAYTKSMNLLHVEYEKIKRARTVQKIVGAPDEQPGKQSDA